MITFNLKLAFKKALICMPGVTIQMPPVLQNQIRHLSLYLLILKTFLGFFKKFLVILGLPSEMIKRKVLHH